MRIETNSAGPWRTPYNDVDGKQEADGDVARVQLLDVLCETVSSVFCSASSVA